MIGLLLGLLSGVDAGLGASDAAVAADRAPTVVARVDRGRAHVGDVIRLTVTALGPRATPVNLPAVLDLGPFTVLDRQEAENDLGDGRMRREFRLQIAAYEPGEVEVPPIEVTYLGKSGEVLTARTAVVPVTLPRVAVKVSSSSTVASALTVTVKVRVSPAVPVKLRVPAAGS
jgi:hypothetical protein